MARGKHAAPVQAIVGEDSYLAEQALERVLAAAVGEDRQDAVQVFQGDERKWEDVLSAARTGSLFVSRRAIVVRRADRFVQDRKKGEEDGEEGSDDSGSDRAVSARGRTRRADGKGVETRATGESHPLLAYLGDPNPDVTLVLLLSKPDKRRLPWSRFFKALPKEAVHNAASPNTSGVRSFVAAEVRRRGIDCEPGVVEVLAAEVGRDLRRVITELDKLEAWTGGGRRLTEEDVDAVLGQGLAKPLYQLADALWSRDRAAGVALVAGLLEGRSGSDATGVAFKTLATFYRTLRQVRAATAMLAARGSRAEIAQALLPANMQWKADALLDAARRWSEADLRRAMRVLGRTDRRMKRGADAATALVAAVAESCGGGGAATSPRRER
jgi:DNA polymerase III delta subunit